MYHSKLSICVTRVLALAYLIFIGPTQAAPSESTAITILLGQQIPEHCQLLGKVKGSSQDENQTGEDDTPYIERLVKARNHLRIEAQKLGGDTVHVTYANNSGRYEIPGYDKEIFFIGDVYRCE